MFEKLRLAFAILCLCLIPFATAKGDLEVFYTFEGNALDLSGNGNDGIINGATVSSNGFEGSALSFDGIDDFVEVMLDINTATLPEVTFGAWVNAESLGLQAIVTHDTGGFDRALYIDSRGIGSNFRYSTFLGTGVGSAGPDPATLNKLSLIHI